MSTLSKTKIPRFLRRLFPNLKKVVNSPKGILVSVNESDCKNAVPNSPQACAMAKAIKRKYKAEGAVIGIKSSYVISGTIAIRFFTPVSVQREITSFDRHGDFEPGHYCLSPISPSKRNVKRSGPPRSGSHKIKRIVHKRTIRIRQLNEQGTQ